jgi:hypothetical protein
LKHIQQENSARRFSPDQFDCELPEDVRRAFSAPKRARILRDPPAPTQASPEPPPRQAESVHDTRRARILGSPPPPPPGDLERSWGHLVMLGICGLFFVIALCAVLNWSTAAPTRVASGPLSPPLGEPTPVMVTPAPAPAASAVPGGVQPAPPLAVRAPDPEVRRAELVPVPVRRAELIPVTVRRAGLWRLPAQELGVYKYYPVPDEFGGGAVWARFMGTVANFSDIPKSAVPGDVWNVADSGTTWILCTPPGYTHAIWLDP